MGEDYLTHLECGACYEVFEHGQQAFIYKHSDIVFVLCKSCFENTQTDHFKAEHHWDCKCFLHV